MSWAEGCVVSPEDALGLSPEAARRVIAVLPIAEAAARRHGVAIDLLLGMIWVESRFRPRAKSSAGAAGLCQLMPATFVHVQRSMGLDVAADRYDPETNINAGAWLLGRLLRRYGGDVTLALAAYNAGAGNVKKYGGVPPFVQTRAYVRAVPQAAENFRIAREERCQGRSESKLTWGRPPSTGGRRSTPTAPRTTVEPSGSIGIGGAVVAFVVLAAALWGGKV